MVTELIKCNTCKECKPPALMRKDNRRVSTQCVACAHKVRKIRDARIKEQKEAIRAARIAKEQQVEVVEVVEETLVVPPRTFKFTPYVPEKHWVRNNGNVHIPSRGFQC